MLRFLVLFICFVHSVPLFAQNNVFPKNGFVGIQTSTPKVALDVRGITFSNALVLGNEPVNKKAIFTLNYSDEKPDTILFLIENKERKLLQLSNDGILRAREIIVDADLWPDYVFEKDYTLMPLNELNNYIQLHKHLPHIPSAVAMDKNGINLSEMNSLLLEKIEELTLYLIEQQKEIDQLKLQLQKE
jgi:hypothetical protein